MAQGNNSISNIISYTGTNNKTFDEMPFNNADGLALSQLSRIKLSSDYGIDMYGGGSKTLSEVAKKYMSEHRDKTTNEYKLLKSMANNPRYKDMQLSNFVENPAKNGKQDFSKVQSSQDADIEQFAAVTVTYKQNGKTTHYMSFRATDGTANGWAEDTLMLPREVTQAQLDGKNYIEQVAKKFPDGDLVGGGHSKGGNNFEYGYLTCDESVRDRIVAGYLYDSPGLNPEIVKDNMLDYDRFQQLIKNHFLCPQDSIVGMMLHENKDASFIYSASKNFFYEHDPYSWEIDPQTGEFTPKEQSPISKYLNDLLDVAVYRMPQEQREALYGFVYYIMKTYKDNGKENKRIEEVIKDLEDLFKGKDAKENLKKLLPFFLEYWKTLSPEERQHFIQALANILAALIITTEYYSIKSVNNWIQHRINDMGIALYSTAMSLRTFVDRGTGALDDIMRSVYQGFIIALTGVTYCYCANTNPGYRYASENTYIELNTAVMRSYADRLNSVNRRVCDLDRRMDALYKQVGLRDLQKLIRADLMTGYNWHIVNCARYLEDTANDFDTVERDVSSQF